MSNQPFLPFFFGDFLAATPTWEGEERALYMLLLAYQWTSGPLPVDPKRLAKMCQYEPRTFNKLWQTVSKKFTEQPDGLINLRLEEHRAKAKEVSKKRAQAGADGAAKRWQKPPDEDGKPMANAIANAIPLQSHPSHPIPESESKSRCAALAIDPGEPRKQLYALGKSILGQTSGSLISKQIALSDERTVASVLGEMALSAKADPKAYFVAATTPKQRGFVA